MEKIEVVSGKSMAVPGVGSGDLAVGVPQLAAAAAVAVAFPSGAPGNGCARPPASRHAYAYAHEEEGMPASVPATSPGMPHGDASEDVQSDNGRRRQDCRPRRRVGKGGVA
jgi:hypothetical protein